jgi:hypothetical protein
VLLAYLRGEAVEGVQTLYLGQCGLRALPEGIGRLVGLKKLSLGSNSELAALPEGMWSLVGLEELDLSNCGLRSLSEGVGGLAGLWSLNLSGNTELTALPAGLGQLGNLEELVIEYCPGLTVEHTLVLHGQARTAIDVEQHQTRQLAEPHRQRGQLRVAFEVDLSQPGPRQIRKPADPLRQRQQPAAIITIITRIRIRIKSIIAEIEHTVSGHRGPELGHRHVPRAQPLPRMRVAGRPHREAPPQRVAQRAADKREAECVVLVHRVGGEAEAVVGVEQGEGGGGQRVHGK